MARQANPETALSGLGVHARNRRLRLSYLELASLAERAERSGDRQVAAQLRERMEAIFGRFVALNRNLVADVARPFRTSDGSANWEDYDAAGEYGLCEAFLKWDPDSMHRDRSTGKLKRVTFGTFSRPYIAGRVKREVNTIERQGKYHDFTDSATIAKVEQKLIVNEGIHPSNEELAEAASKVMGRRVTVDQVVRVRRPAPVSLDKKVGSDTDSASLHELLVEPSPAETAGLEVDPDTLGELTCHLGPLELFLVLQRDELSGASSQTINQLTAVTGLGREMLRRRYHDARTALAARIMAGPVTDTSEQDEPYNARPEPQQAAELAEGDQPDPQDAFELLFRVQPEMEDADDELMFTGVLPL
jgi:DNA-directed RNA polymerase sigma subunit (sigma70/sigma32)